MKIAFALICLLSLLGQARGQNAQANLSAKAGLDQKLNAQLPLNLAFHDEHGAGTPLAAYLGSKPAILVLAYYECPNMCTLVLNALLQSAQDLKFEIGKEYQIIVVSIDPHEGPALAAAKKQLYTQRYGRPGAANGWHFLTGDEASIRSVANAVGFRFIYDPETRQFAHPSVITVLTPAGKISRYFAGIEYPPKDLRLALIEASNNHIGSLTEQLFLLCFHYDPASGKYGLLIKGIIQFAGLTTVVVLGCGITLMLRREHPSPS
jgi:protein SCO1